MQRLSNPYGLQSIFAEPHVSTLSKIVEAMGGELQIVAKMPNGNVKIRQFTQIREDETETAALR
jgi:hypothetical protein